MKLTVLGCNGPYPEPGGACSGYLLESGETRVLIDCGTGVLARLTAIMPPEKLDAVILSHLHYDHMSDMLPLIYKLQGAGKKLPVYAPEGPQPVRALLESGYDVHDIDTLDAIGDLKLSVLPVRHPAPCRAVRALSGDCVFCYTGDTNTCDTLADFVRGCDLLLADGCFPVSQWAENKPHLSAYLASEVAAKADVERLVITHFTPGTDRETLLAEAQKCYPEARLACSGLTVEF
ncbi:MAG: MBL fold metallo-hydrolase [Clostridia bacterium]|nr:MBL fold metallo-hydrolase [Clostridia bacterium]